MLHGAPPEEYSKLQHLAGWISALEEIRAWYVSLPLGACSACFGACNCPPVWMPPFEAVNHVTRRFP